MTRIENIYLQKLIPRKGLLGKLGLKENSTQYWLNDGLTADQITQKLEEIRTNKPGNWVAKYNVRGFIYDSQTTIR
jgi:hypothetical protein